MKRWKARSGFTLIEIMIVVALLLLLSVIVAPNLLRARENTQRTLCLYHRRLIQDMISQWALVASKGPGDAIDRVALAEYAKTGQLPLCKAGNTAYDIGGTVNEPVILCSRHPD
ncbi:MAG: prepilin-type N-terminal cleavage/methylation domain-containing protein [Lentisphaerae bacterium]|nr:prepilin-type N-terminal cleavage/methylation domain-containing protein [Lentisphaerota bacterium]